MKSPNRFGSESKPKTAVKSIRSSSKNPEPLVKTPQKKVYMSSLGNVRSSGGNNSSLRKSENKEERKHTPSSSITK